MVSIQVKFVNSKAHGVQDYILSLRVNLHFCVILTPFQMKNFPLSQEVPLCFYSFLPLAAIFLFFIHRQFCLFLNFKKRMELYKMFTFVPGFVAQNVGEIHLCCTYPQFVSFCYSVVLCFMNISQFILSLVYGHLSYLQFMVFINKVVITCFADMFSFLL